MSDFLRLRPYQREAIDAVQDAFYAEEKFPAVVVPTGSGKTVMFAHLAAEHMASKSTRVMIIVHRDELADQAMDKIRRVAPHLRIGKVKAESDQVSSDVVVVSVQTASRENRLKRLVGSERSRKFGLIITDECHHAVAASYKAIYKAFPRADKVGFTATLARGDGVGLGSVIGNVAYTKSILWMISKKYLVDPIGREITVDLDLSQVRKSGEDYASGSLGTAMVDSGTGAVIARAYQEHAGDRSGVVFTPSVAAAHDTAQELSRVGVPAAVVTGTTAREERLKIYEQSRTGAVQVIVNCGVLTEGFDAPWLSCVVPRMTQSAPLFQQMVGRVLRTFPGKRDALVLSVGGTGGRLRTLIDLEPGSVKNVRPGEALTDAVVREAEEDNRIIPASSPAFALRHRDTDMFAASGAVWLRTEGGVMFIPVTDGQIFLWPGQGGTWEVRHAPRDARKWPKLHGGMPLEMAMAWGETEAEDRDHGAGSARSVSGRAASWRKRKSPPSPAQLSAARSWGVDVPPGATRAEVSDLIHQKIATVRFDRYIPRAEAAVSAG